MNQFYKTIGIGAIAYLTLGAADNGCSFQPKTERVTNKQDLVEAVDVIRGHPTKPFSIAIGENTISYMAFKVEQQGKEILASANCDYSTGYHCANAGALILIENEKPDGIVTLEGKLADDGVFTIRTIQVGDYKIELSAKEEEQRK